LQIQVYTRVSQKAFLWGDLLELFIGRVFYADNR